MQPYISVVLLISFSSDATVSNLFTTRGMSIMKLKALSLTALLATAAFPAAAQTWSSTHTQALTSLTQAVDLGPTSPTQQVTVRVILPIQNQAALLGLVKSQNTPGNPNYGHFLTPSQFAASFGPTAAQVASVNSYLKSAGFSGVTVEPNNLMVSGTGTAAQASAAFNTKLENFSQNGRTVFANTTAVKVPSSLSSSVVAVLGLNNAGTFAPTIAKRSAGNVPTYLASYNPQNYWQIYNAAGVPFATNATIAIMAEGDLTGVLDDLRTEEQANGLQQTPVTVVPVGLPSTDTSGADEFDLDTQYSSGMAGNVSMLYVYDVGSLYDADLALEISRWATDGLARAASASLGECELFPYLDGTTLAVDQTLLEAAAQGMSFFASSGDTGGFCPAGVGTNGVPAGVPLVQYPAASTYATAVGGTTLLTNSDGSYDTEIAWYAGGGGTSQFEGAPPWQQSAGILLASEENDRGVPDIAMDADPESGANVWVDGSPEGVGGTSLSSPLALGVWARLISANPALGYAPLQFYSLYSGSTTPGTYPAGGFHDITVGTNVPWAAAPGWDYTTGLGTLNVGQLYTDLDQ